ncbi:MULTISPECIES: TIGR01457 family HAD-type hydrolase [unclassified Lactobacillus]|uniref:TIGR01457 family HAD-type hydrolase n=1 Tax=unclassified Lactobacillus TaxID=2620435 RepID=UPI000EFC3125|nr:MULTISPECIES: TIGR01457 family HAD-type hydrolase [unclassified Lactobacillus]RMC25545.1 TIGR01457 family HAD-type hydrolase [Lactobacillus sp. ESL0247]RMC29449.1 TIGR01457 family HAD-type hydrolase [Lactobacillus sp. ESL0246]RMC33178.1 TIGR01457 family HAD-type hydrolase [Lactobacillus sp. ESL0245]
MKDYRLFLVDLDGTIYRGNYTIAAGVRFIKRLDQAKKDYIFLTNNTTRTPQMVVEKLAQHGIKTDTTHIYTPNMATIDFLLDQEKDRIGKIGVYLIGQVGLWNEFWQHSQFELNEENPNYVIVGMDTDLTYHKVQVATNAIRNGAIFISTNGDLNLPSDQGLMPGNGAQCAMIAAASGKKPLIIGKPSKIIIDKLLVKMHCLKENALLVGDNYETDIKAGFNSHVDQLLVTSGITQRKDIVDQKQPTFVVNNLDEFKL